MKFSFNLVDEPWIPCISLQGASISHLGIADTLLQAQQFREIHDASPLVTVSLHRLLLAILYRACAPLENKGQWLQLWRSGRFAPDRIEPYLHRWRDRFDLFSEQYPFYQVAELKTSAPDTASRLATEAASGNNPTLFDHSSDDSLPAYSPASIARLLVAAQSFVSAFGISSKARLGGKEIERPRFTDAILLRGATVWLTGDNLFETLLLSLVPHRADPGDLPCWELDDPNSLMDNVTTRGRRTHSARGPLDRFTWQSRLIRLLPETSNGLTVVRHLYFTQGRSADKSPEDPMKAYRKDERQGIVPVPLSARKAAWRDVHTLLALRRDDAKRPDSFNLAAEMVEDGVLDRGHLCQLHMVGLASAPSKASKFVLWRHERMPLPAALLQDADLIENLGLLIAEAENTARDLDARMWYVSRLFLAPQSDRQDGRKPDPDNVRQLLNDLNPQRAYWARLEGHFYELLQGLAVDTAASRERWRDAVEREARKAFDEACAALGTSVRAIRAVARVSGRFRIADRPQQPSTAEQTVVA